MYLNILKKINIFDNYILFIIKKYMQNKYLDRLMPMVTSMGNLGAIWILIAVILMLDKSYRLIGNIVILTLIISTIVGEGIVKHIVRRIRPYNGKNNSNILISKPTTYSFPSGHTLSSFAVAEMLSMYLNKYTTIFIVIAFLIAVSRIYLYVHYPTDVIAGVIIGVLCSKMIFIILHERHIASIILLYQNIFIFY
ncbi:phosphatase PAP2 family protein [uncultured Clostridium sp.]|uniref:phosphatase PAP2 family protein n=1 Tax=uncultured Clostridium sp. TaxID=59620 RepID=UPI0028EF9558|nr:phosphatase PAP2 family protein [uncultured Clostridium sp.]